MDFLMRLDVVALKIGVAFRRRASHKTSLDHPDKPASHIPSTNYCKPPWTTPILSQKPQIFL